MLNEYQKFYFLGIGGVSMSALALLLENRGREVKGSDDNLSPVTQNLAQQGIEVVCGGSPKFTEWADCLVCTSAIGEDNADIKYAQKLGKKIFSRAEILGEFSKEKKTISVAGTHGKTTTTGMISSILLTGEYDPTIHIGGQLKNINSNLHIGHSDLFVTESCEYKDAFLSLSSYISVVLNIEEDHLDYFKNFQNIVQSFNKFIKNTSKKGFIIYNYENCHKKLEKNILKNHKSISFGLSPYAQLRGKNLKEREEGITFEVVFQKKDLGRVFLPCHGKHNMLNALASIASCIAFGVDFEVIKNGLKNYQGVARRMEVVCHQPFVIHDYAHHPQEIVATLNSLSPKEKIVCIFQPHTFSRTKSLYEEFLSSFSICDEVWLLPIYPAREKPIKGVSSFNLHKDLKQNGQKSRYFSSFSRCYQEIIKYKNSNNLFVILGAGDIENLAKMFSCH